MYFDIKMAMHIIFIKLYKLNYTLSTVFFFKERHLPFPGTCVQYKNKQIKYVIKKQNTRIMR